MFYDGIEKPKDGPKMDPGRNKRPPDGLNRPEDGLNIVPAMSKNMFFLLFFYMFLNNCFHAVVF